MLNLYFDVRSIKFIEMFMSNIKFKVPFYFGSADSSSCDSGGFNGALLLLAKLTLTSSRNSMLINHIQLVSIVFDRQIRFKWIKFSLPKFTYDICRALAASGFFNMTTLRALIALKFI